MKKKILMLITLCMFCAAFLPSSNAGVVSERLDDMLEDSLAYYSSFEGGRLGYAMVAAYKGIEFDTVNENIEWYHLNRDDVPDDDTWDFDTYWDGIQIILRLYLQPACYSSLNSDSKDILEDILWRYINHRSKVSDAALSQWYYNGTISENHDVMRKVVFLLGAQALEGAGEPYGADRLLADGKTISEHRKAWEKFWFEYFRQRAREGVNCEIASPGYGKHTVQTYYAVHDLTNNNELSDLAGRFLDLYWADTASDYLRATGLRGGAQTRCYKKESLTLGSRNDTHGFRHLFYAYNWHNDDVSNIHMPSVVYCAMSDYRVADIITACAAATAKEPFLYTSRRFGRGISWDGSHIIDFDGDTNNSNLRRDTYVTSNYVMGTLSLDQSNDYTQMVNQNRAMGVFFGSGVDDRVVVHGEAADWNDFKGYREIHGLCGAGCMVVARDVGAKRSGTNIGTRIFVSKGRLWNNRIEDDNGWFFSYSGNTYIGIKIATGTTPPYYTVQAVEDGFMLDLEDMWAPIVIETGLSQDYNEMFRIFRNSVKSNTFDYSDDKLTYVSEKGDSYEIWRENESVAKMNGSTVELNPEKTYDSPYISSYHGSNIVRLMYPGYEDVILDFNYNESPKWDDWQTVALWDMDSTQPLGTAWQTIGLWHMDDINRQSRGWIYSEPDNPDGSTRFTTRDSEGSDVDACTLVPGPTAALGNAIYFDSSEFARSYSSQLWDESYQSVKVQGWVYIDDDYSGDRNLIVNSYCWRVYIEGDRIRFLIYDDQASSNAITFVVSQHLGEWLNFTAIYDETGFQSFEVSNLAGTWSEYDSKQHGRNFRNPVDGYIYIARDGFKGAVDELQISRVGSIGFVEDNDLENTSRDRHLALSGGGINITTGEGGKFGEALYFDGIDDYAVATVDWQPEQSVQVEFWFKADDTSFEKTIINAHNVWELRQRGGNIVFWVWEEDGNARSAVVENIVDTDKWQHCRAAIDGLGNVLLVVDGSSGVSAGKPMVLKSAEIKVGNKSGQTRWYAGKIDDLKISTNLSPLEVQCSIDISQGDINSDCVVDMEDLLILSDNWLWLDVSTPCVSIDADINDDCIVDIFDFGIIAENWLTCGWQPQSYCP